MSRDNETERLGVTGFLHLMTKLHWIAREQSIVDVGIDAIIEQKNDGEPTGKMIGVQIKSGDSNVHKHKTGYTYYASNIHYHYWLNYDLPVLLVFYSIKEDKYFWQNMSKSNFVKNKKSWKIDIPFENVLSEDTNSDLNAMLNKTSISINKDEKNPFENIVGLQYSAAAKGSSEMMMSAIRIFNEDLVRTNQNLSDSAKHGFTIESIQNQPYINKIIFNLDALSMRLKTENGIYSKVFTHAAVCFQKSAKLAADFPESINNYKILYDSWTKLPPAFKVAAESAEFLKSKLLKWEKVKKLYEPLKQVIEEIETVILDLFEASDLVEKICNEILKSGLFDE